MNFLAHALLAGDAEADRIGGLMGDFVKGLLPAGLPPELASGVALHRAIDSFADRHPAFIASRARVSPLRRRVSGVLVDLFYDHLLARDWADFRDDALAHYCAGVYRQLGTRLADLPAGAHHALELMAREDWLQSYAGLEGIADVLARMSRRARQPNPLAGGEVEFIAAAEGFERDFREWLPDAQRFVADWLATR